MKLSPFRPGLGISSVNRLKRIAHIRDIAAIESIAKSRYGIALLFIGLAIEKFLKENLASSDPDDLRSTTDDAHVRAVIRYP